MRRKKQQLTQTQAEAILGSNSSGVLSMEGEGGYPYAVPLNYWFDGARIWFHCATAGYKLSCLRKNDKVSFCVIGRDKLKPELFTSLYESVVVFGRVRIIEEEDEAAEALRNFTKGIFPMPELAQALEREVEGTRRRVLMLCLEIEHMTGKAAKELIAEERPLPAEERPLPAEESSLPAE